MRELRGTPVSEPDYPPVAHDPEASGWLADLAQERASKHVYPAGWKPGVPLVPFGVDPASCTDYGDIRDGPFARWLRERAGNMRQETERS